jgi:hypothetical protein
MVKGLNSKNDEEELEEEEKAENQQHHARDDVPTDDYSNNAELKLADIAASIAPESIAPKETLKKAKKRVKKARKTPLIQGARRLQPLSIGSKLKRKVRGKAKESSGAMIDSAAPQVSPHHSLMFSPDSSPISPGIAQEPEKTIACMDMQREAMAFLGEITFATSASAAPARPQDERVEETQGAPAKPKGKGLRLVRRFKKPSREIKAVVKKIANHRQEKSASYQEKLNYILTAEMETLFVFAKHGNVRQAKMLLDRTKLDPNFVYKGLTMLHVASCHGQTDMTSFLLQHKADPKQTDHNGNTAGDLAKKEGHDHISELISAHEAEQSRSNAIKAAVHASKAALKKGSGKKKKTSSKNKQTTAKHSEH